ncbi:pentapeptide repeat-containing protein [Kouleothrix sp.]|uniref:pentapeptide repeat-containing protein n=1 Tax=Kouleothrix sp. TaxID=2779161 RepID=UPI00391DB780
MQLWKRLLGVLVRLGIAGIIIACIASIVAAAYFAALFPSWTGFAADPIPPNAAITPVVVYQPAKTLWDWLQLLLVPLVLAVGGYWLTRSENRYALQLQERREAEARKIEDDRAQDAALQSYLDQITQLLLHEKLRTSQPDDEVRSIARARTLTVLRVLDGLRKATVLQFLYEANLIGSIKLDNKTTLSSMSAIVSLEGADLTLAHLPKAMLNGAILSGVNLSDADLNEAYLAGTDLSGASLSGTFLKGAELSGATLSRTNLDGANLEKAYLYKANLQGALLREANLREASLREADLRVADLQAANLFYADLKGTDLREASLFQANLRCMNLRVANLVGTDLRGTDLREAKLTGVDLRGADLQKANLLGADLRDAILIEANLQFDCKVTAEQLAQARSLKDAKLPFGMHLPPAPEARATPQNDNTAKHEAAPKTPEK